MATTKSHSNHSAIEQFVAEQKTIPAPQEERKEMPYSEYWFTAVACMLLSGRVKPKNDGYPNRTDINRICKQANFNQFYFDSYARFFIRSKIIESDHKIFPQNYVEGTFFQNFWNDDFEGIQKAAGNAFLEFVKEHSGHKIKRPTTVNNSGLIEFLKLFFSSFEGLALPEKKITKIFAEFSRLPGETLLPLMEKAGLKKNIFVPTGWKDWLDEKGREALISAMGAVEWIYATEHNGKDWLYLNYAGRAMLGLDPSMPALPERNTDFKILPDLRIFAGVGLPVKTLVPFFRHCKIAKISEVFEFKLDKKVMAEVPSKTPADEVLSEALRELEPLPATVTAFLKKQSQAQTGGTLRIRYCSAIVKPENPELLSVIRSHPKLKGYLEPKPPAVYLLIKYGSNVNNFIRRCREFGFTVTAL